MNLELDKKHLPLFVVSALMTGGFGSVSWSQSSDINVQQGQIHTIQDVVVKQAVTEQRMVTLEKNQAEAKQDLKEILNRVRGQQVQPTTPQNFRRNYYGW